MPDSSALVLPLEAVGLEAIDAVGGKNASLGEMLRALAAEGVRVPGGFALTASAYRLLLSRDGLGNRLETILSGLDANNLEQLQRVGLAARQLLLDASLPPELEAALLTAYRGLVGPGEEPAAVAVRSSATAEDLPEASFAGQQDTFLHIQGEAQLLAATRRCYASLFTDRALSYRQHNGFGHLAVALSIGVQRMVLADRACSGVMFSLDTESGFRDTVLLSAAYGLGENVVQGVVNPDELLIFKPTLALGFDPILSRRLGSKEQRLVNQGATALGGTALGGTALGGTDLGANALVNEPVPLAEQRRFALSDAEALQLARWACRIEAHYSDLRGQPTPMDIEWAKDGPSGELFILQARPETVRSRQSTAVLRSWHLDAPPPPPLVTGRAIGASVSSGRARLIRDPGEIQRFAAGDVLVTSRTDPDWEPILKRASGVVTDQGGRTCHAAIIARLLGGAAFEPQEENPMLGWRGASRYYAPAFREAFALECLALRQVRQEMGLSNVIPMVPFCRTPEEGDRVLAEMARNGLVRGQNGLQVYVMCELPSNVIGAEAFAERFDGFSIGSNDLTQLTLGLDRDSALVADLFDERHPTVKEMIRLAIRTAHRCGRPIGLCGQAPSDYPDFARFLVQEGIDSISLNPDALVATRLTIAQLEAELAANP